MAQPRSPKDNERKATPGVMGGAAVVGATVGAIVSGPLVALALGVGAAGLTLSDNKAGEVARSTGRAGVAAIDKGKEMYHRYGVGHKVKGAVHATSEKAKELDEKHRIVENAKVGASRAWTSLKEFDREHHVSTRAGDAIVQTMDGAATALSNQDGSSLNKESSSSQRR